MNNKISNIKLIDGNISKYNVEKKRNCCGLISLILDNVITIKDIGVAYNKIKFLCLIPKCAQWNIVNRDFEKYINDNVIEWCIKEFGSND